MNSERFSLQTVLTVTHWASNLMSIRTTRPAHFKFEAGQFARVGLAAPDSSWLFRALSVVSSPFDEHLEFFISLIPGGAFSGYIASIREGHIVALEHQALGYLTLSRFAEPAPHDLWLLATGTGIAPFLSILQDFSIWQRYRHIVLAYSVRHQAELAYADQLAEWTAPYRTHIPFIFIPIITREPSTDTLHQRIPELITNGQLEQHANMQLAAKHSHILLCGNPQMIEETRNILKTRGLTMNRRSQGNIAVENYW